MKQMLIAIGLNINGVNNTHNINSRYLLCAFFIFNMPTLNAHAKAYQPAAIIPIMQSAMSPNNSRNSIIQIIIKSFYFIIKAINLYVEAVNLVLNRICLPISLMCRSDYQKQQYKDTYLE